MAKHSVLKHSAQKPNPAPLRLHHAMAGRSGLNPLPGSTPDAENRTSGGVGGSRRAITMTRPDPRRDKRFAPGRPLASRMRTKFRTTEISLCAARFSKFCKYLPNKVLRLNKSLAHNLTEGLTMKNALRLTWRRFVVFGEWGT